MWSVKLAERDKLWSDEVSLLRADRSRVRNLVVCRILLKALEAIAVVRWHFMSETPTCSQIEPSVYLNHGRGTHRYASWPSSLPIEAKLTKSAVLFKFRKDTAQSILHSFSNEIRKLKSLPCVLDQRLVLGGPSLTIPEHRSKGFQYCLLSYHKDRGALEEYQASREHHE